MLESRSAYGWYGSEGGYTGETKPVDHEEQCWKTGNYTDSCDCDRCYHKHDCSGYDEDDD